MELAVGKVVGKPSQGRWGQVHDFSPEDEEKRQNRGRLVAAVSVMADEGAGQVQIVSLGREVLSRLQEMYYGVGETPAMEQLKTAIIRTAEEFPGLQIAAAAFVGGMVYLATGGGAGVWVSSENGRQGWLVKPEAAEQEFQVKSFGGKQAAGRVLVIGTHDFWSQVTERLLVAAIAKSESNFVEAVEMVVSEVQAGEGESGGSGVLIKIQNPVLETENLKEEPLLETPEKVRIGNKWREMMKKLAGQVYVKPGDKQDRRKKLLVAGLVFMGILAALFAGGQVWNQRRQAAGSEKEKAVEKIQYDFDEAKAMTGLNPVRSRELLLQVKRETETVAGEKKDERLTTIMNEWQLVWDEAAGIKKIQTEELLDLGLVRDGMNGDKMAKLDDELLILDIKLGRVASVNSKTAAGKVVAGGEEWESVREIGVYPGRIYVSGAKTIWEVSQGKVIVRIDDKEMTGEPVDFKVWAGNIYMLVNNENSFRIRRYQVKGEGFGPGQEWLTEEAGANLPLGVGIAIDGSIWVAGETEIFKFTRGVREGLVLSGWDEMPARIDGLYTDENSESLFVWEKGKSRIVVVSKEGVYLKQYQGETLGKAADFVIDETAGLGYILAEGKVWKFAL